DAPDPPREHAPRPGRAADRRRMPDGDGIDPPAGAGPAGHGPILLAPPPDPLAGLIVLLGRERPATDSGRIGLDDADPAVDPAGRHAGPRRDARRAAVGAGHVGIAAVGDVQEGTLGPLGEEPAVPGPGLGQPRAG